MIDTTTAEIVTEEFPELYRVFDIKAGVLNEPGNPQSARSEFAQAMRKHGYVAETGGTWMKPGFAVVLSPY